MKTKLLLFAILFVLVFPGFAQNPQANNPAIGTWKQVTIKYLGVDGKEQPHPNASAARYQTITSTNWTRTSTKEKDKDNDKKLESQMGGTYTMQGDKVFPVMEYASFQFPVMEYASYPANKSEKLEITQRVEGDKMYWNGIVTDASGKTKISFEEVFQRVK